MPPPSLPKSVVWSPLDGIGDNEQDPLLREIPKVKAGDGIVVLGAPVGYHAFHLDPGCAIFVRDFFRWSVFGIMTKLMGSPKTHGVTGHVGIREF